MEHELDSMTGETDTSPSVAPFADLLFSVSTIIIVVLVALLPALGPGSAMTRTDDPLMQKAVEAAVITSRNPALLITADAEGLVVSDRLARREYKVPLNDLLTDHNLVTSLEAVGTRPVAVIVQASGNEAFFELDSLAARHGIRSLLLLRRP